MAAVFSASLFLGVQQAVGEAVLVGVLTSACALARGGQGTLGTGAGRTRLGVRRLIRHLRDG